MAKVVVPHSCIFAIVIFLLLALSVGLLVFVLKGQIHHENATTQASDGTIHLDEKYQRAEHNPTPKSSLATSHRMDQSDSSAVTTVTVLEEYPWQNFRLPKYIIPLHYDLKLHPDLKIDKFTGQVNITVNVTSHTRYFLVHAHKLVITSSKVHSMFSREHLTLKKEFAYAPNEYFVLELKTQVIPGIYVLKFEFGGNLTGNIIGFYKSTYRNSKNESRSLASSKFQPTYARRAFPCFDEPTFKSTFTVSLVHDPSYIALSNMPVEITDIIHESNLAVTRFQKSVPMVTYLACFIVCDFNYTHTTTSNGKSFRVYSTPDKINKTRQSLKFGSRVLEFFEEYFDVDYPLPKQDMVAIPDFVSGAMEHWGVITYRETNLLYDESNPNTQSQQRINTVISHEMAHQWFGNLVTMKWWDDLWLNEGFASYIEYKGVDNQYPEWDILSQFVEEDLQSVMELDSTTSSHPIVQPVNHPDEITEIFDDISYKKGASVLRMLEFFVGKENFQKGISNFLKKYKFKNAKTTDLWEELSFVYGTKDNHTVSSIMRTWTEQMGFPYVTVQRDGQNFIAWQKRFLRNEELQRNAKFDSTWNIPLSYITANGTTGIVWIHDNLKTNFTIPIQESEWIKFNINQTGFYIVNYERKDWQKLIDVLMINHEALSPTDRSNLLFDTYLLAEAGHIGFDIFLSLCSYLKNETRLVPWETAYSSLVRLCQLLEFTDSNILLKVYIRDLTDSLYKKLSWKRTGNHLEDLLSIRITGLACHSGNDDCLSHTAELFQNWTKGQNIPPDLRNIVFHYGMTEIGREEHWNYMWNKYLNEKSATIRKSYLYGLAYTKIPKLIHRYLEYAMDEKMIRRQDFHTVLSYIAGNPVGRPFVWNFIQEKWPQLVQRFTLNDRYLGFSVKRVCSYFTGDIQLAQMNSFFAKYPDAGAGKRKRQQALETVQNNIRFLKTYKEEIKHWLEMEGSAPWYYHRLPKYIVPEHYDLLLQPILEENRFIGTVAISVAVQKETGFFILHAHRDLNVTKVEISSSDDGKNVLLSDMFRYEKNDYLVLQLSNKISTGGYRLYFEFNGPLASDLKGLYKSTYKDPYSKKERYLAVTHFESIYARKVFPCLDEPSFKATFNISVLHKSTFFSLSNMMAASISELENNMHLTKFEKTLPMSTYLVCIVVTDFEFTETIAENGVRLRAYSAPHLLNKTTFALNTGSKILVYFEDYFNISYPLNKLDMIAVPDLRPNGMENWGLITFDEEAIIVDNSTTSISRKITTAMLVAHEIAHMWFGDLVTMDWWNDLWLNEGFATFLSEKGTQHIYPEYYKANDSGVKRICSTMRNDQSIHSHPIEQRVAQVTDDIFDSIAYNKGSSILRMLEVYMGDDFQKGVINYLRKYSFRNSKTEILWTELTAASTKKINVSAIMETWTKQMNYPYIDIKRTDENMVLQQRWFLADLENKMYSTQMSAFQYIWKIPLSYRTAENENASYLLLESSESVNLSVPETKWIKFNVNFSGYYSVNYAESDWKNFANLLENNFTILSPSDRVNLLFDAFNLADAGIISYEIPLNLTRYLKKEDYHESWNLVLTRLNIIRQYFYNDQDMWFLIKEYMRDLSKDLYKKHGWNNTGNYLNRVLRKQLIKAACDNNNYDCLNKAADDFITWTKGEKLDPETAPFAYEYGLRYINDKKSFQFLIHSYLNETDPSKKATFKFPLSTVRNTTLLERLIKYSRNETYFRKSWQINMLINIAKNPKGAGLIANHIFNNWNNLVRSYGNISAEKLALEVFSQYGTEKDLERVRQFHRKHKPAKECERYRARSIEAIRFRIKWQRNNRHVVSTWFQKNVYMPWKKVRLPRNVYPIRYTIELNPNMKKSKFDGKVEIEVNVTEKTNYILIHQDDLRIHDTQVWAKSGHLVYIMEVFPYPRNDYWVIRFHTDISPGAYDIKLNYSGHFALDGKGMSIYHYTHRQTEEKRSLLATRFEATYARRVFPCFDEPDMKATFKTTIAHDATYTALSNMPEETKELIDDNLAKTTFKESVLMPTYSVCFVVADYDYIEIIYKGKPVRAYAPPDRIQEAERGLNLTVQFLSGLEEYFDVPYQLPKLDSVAIPSYTVPGMEHWGVITYNTKRFLEDSSLTAHRKVVEVDRVIAHELVHQWFGNLVTMKWWNDVWLNEGAATLLMYIPLSQYYPNINEVDVRKISKMMCTDSNIDSNPVLRNVTTPKEINEIFDAISYEKGGAVLKMLQYSLKEDFRKGISNYLKKYAFKNADTDDLWSELTQASSTDINIVEMMVTWTEQIGFPYIELHREGNKLNATQHWFLRKVNDTTAQLLANNPPFSKFNMTWIIPLIYRNLATGKEHTLWLYNKSVTFEIDGKPEDILKFNPDFVGFYIVKYDEKDWIKIGERLQKRPQDFSTIDRYNLLYDAFQLAESNRLSYHVPLQLTKYLTKERAAFPWTLFRDHFIYFMRKMDGNAETVKLLKKYVQKLTAELFKEFVWIPKDKNFFKTRKISPGSCPHTYPDLEFVPNIVDLSCRSNEPKCLEMLYEDLQQWMMGFDTTVDLQFVFQTAIPHFGNETLWQFLYEKFMDNETTFERKLLMAEGLVAFNSSTLILKTIDEMMWQPHLEVSLIRALFQGLGNNPIALPILWNYTKNHWNLILKRLEASNSPTIGISVFCDNFKTWKYLREFVGFLKQVPQINEFVIHGCMEEIQSAIDWSDKYEETLNAWLSLNTVI